MRIASGNENGYVFENDNADDFTLKLRYKNPTNVYSELMTFNYNGLVAAPGGAVLRSIGIGTQIHGETKYPYETIQMHPEHNLRIWFGTNERFIFQNNGEFRIKFDQGYWVFQTDGNLVKYDNANKALWALNLVSGRVGWTL